MTSVQRVPVIEEVVLSDSDDDIHILDDDELQLSKSTNESSREITNKFPSQNIKSTIEQVYLQGDFEVFDVPDSSDDEAIKNSNVNSTSNTSNYDTLEGRHGGDGAETDDEQFYIDENVNSVGDDEPMDLSLAREDERLSSISSSIMSPSSKSDDDKLSTVSSGVDIQKEVRPTAILKTDEEKPDNVFSEDMEKENITSDDELELAEGELQEISMPSRNDKQYRVRGKTHVETFCVGCRLERRMAGKLWQNKSCRNCKEDLQFQCANCKKRFSSYHSTLCHLKKECLSQEFWNCPKCPYSVLEEKKLEDHIKRVHVDGKEIRRRGKKIDPKADLFSCDKCHAGFKWKVNYRKHKCRKPEIYRCQMCDYTDKSKNLVKRHFHNSHVKGGRVKPKKCSNFITKIDSRPICVPDITSSSNINNETKRKTMEETRAEERRLNESIALHCPKCSRNFEYTGTHVKKCEACMGPLLWRCIPCGELSKSYCGIYEHLQNSCTAMLKSCKKCSKSFASDGDLVKHQHICGQDLYLQCELCDFRTRGKGFFLKHVKDKHNLEGDEIRKWL